ncbi:MAG: Nramp family divalent metal transporter [Pseudomonadales bacterium]|nr:Nramp family divalent metal transporter [Pseudomonadales bacterium]
MSDDPYTIQPGRTREPPTTLFGRLRYLGPGIIVSGSIVGSGEILLTAGLGAVAGFTLLWFVLFSCWIKSLVQAELARYVVTTGDTYLRTLNRMPGRTAARVEPLRWSQPWRWWRPKVEVAWPIWFGLLGFVPGLVTSGGIIGGAGQALGLLLDGVPFVPEVDGKAATGIAAILVMLLLWTGRYGRIERILVVMVMSFTFTTIVCAALMQTTEFQVNADDIVAGFQFDFPLEFLFLAVGMYGATGVASGEIAGYTYWCVEKGYPSFIGGDREDPRWVTRAKGWIRVVQVDVLVTLVILTFATLSFYFLGAGVLHSQGLEPARGETVAILANMFTLTLGDWSTMLFIFGAFFILFSTVLSGLGAGSRSFPDLLVTFGFFPRQNLATRLKWTRGYIIGMPILSFLLYMFIERPIAMVIVGATFGAFMLPIQAIVTLYMQRKRMDPRVQPKKWVTWCIVGVFLAMATLCAFYIYGIYLDNFG